MIGERAKQKPADPRLRFANFEPAAKQTWIGVPADESAYVTCSPATNDDAAKTLRDEPEQFFVAFGWALQGLELAAVDADLTPRKETSGLAKLAGLSLGRRAPTSAWGIELTDVALPAVKLTHAGNREVQIVQAEFLPHGHVPAIAGADVARAEAVDETLREFAAQAGELKNVPVWAGLPAGPQIFKPGNIATRRVSDAIGASSHLALAYAAGFLWSGFAQSQELSGPGPSRPPRPRAVFRTAAHACQRSS